MTTVVRLLCLVAAFYIGVAIALVINAYIIGEFYENVMWNYEIQYWERYYEDSFKNIEPPPAEDILL